MNSYILGDPGADSGDEGKCKRAEKCGAKKSKERRARRAPGDNVLPDQFQKTCVFSGTNQKPERWRPFGTGLVRHCPQGLFLPFFTFLRSIYIFPPV